ncbi:hypothetical protein C2845_PM16G03530 [Panicum miliaceum]|uniref:Uncharacterized protein n=1 Tax=Panicum miliaceum TaxID=4540 RepID=A0A3L6PX32_PANMI|nr:hypothetical protein C2845_PM16G03530 [Panicum miliaceum]
MVELLKDKFGFDAAFNSKEKPDLTAALKRSESDLLLHTERKFDLLCIKN